MTIKYEPVFGDQSKFTKDESEIYVWHDLLGGLEDTIEGFKQRMRPANGNAIIAMRLVIKTPTWTRSDQEAGVLPPVGALITYSSRHCTVEFIGPDINTSFWHVRSSDNELFSANVSNFSPIETPEEKAARLKDEWCETVYALYEHGSIVGKIYETLLSGELKAPTNE